MEMESALEGFDLHQPWNPPHCASYALGDALLSVWTDNPAFHARFQANYAECAVTVLDRDADVVVRVRTLEDGTALATFDGGVAAAPPGFPAIFLPARVSERPARRAGWTVAELDHPVRHLAFSQDGLAAGPDSSWEALIASVAVNRVLSAQPHIIFFHGAAARVNGRGVLLLGVSGAGKTSISLALAARGHDFYGDDIVGVRLESRAMVPLRRAAHVRAGPAASEVTRAIDRSDVPRDGERRLADISRLFPQAGAGAAALDVTVCLRDFTESTRVTPFSPGPQDLRWVTPHAGSLHAGRPAERVMRVLSVLSPSPCFFLDSASPESAADALERLTE